MTLIVDQGSVEVLFDEGRVPITALVFPSKESNGIEFFSGNKDVTIDLKIFAVFPNSYVPYYPLRQE